MPLSLESAQTLALGPFNPYIIDPGWLIRHEICKEGEVELRILPLSNGLTFSFSGVQWQVDFRHLMADSTQANCGELVAQVVGLLKHTPVRGVGNNFRYACGTDDWDTGPLPILGRSPLEALANEGKIEQTRWGCVFLSGDARVEVTVAREEIGMAVLFNFHRETKDAAEAVAAAERFQEDRQRSREVARRLFGQEVIS